MNTMNWSNELLYGVVLSLFGHARDIADPVLLALDGYEFLGVDKQGRPLPPDHVAKKLNEFAPDEVHELIASSVAATNCLGYSYIYALLLLNLLESGSQTSAIDGVEPDLVPLFDALPDHVKQALSATYSAVASQDFEIQIRRHSFQEPPDKESREDTDTDGRRSFRTQLDMWQRSRKLHGSYLNVFGEITGSSTVTLMLPLRSILVLDRIIGDHIAPRMGKEYIRMDPDMSGRSAIPTLEWDGTQVSVELPNRRGNILRARWQPSTVSVIRIRPIGSKEWSPGFETPLNHCTFTGLEPDTEYEIQLTHKDAAGEGLPEIARTKTEGK